MKILFWSDFNCPNSYIGLNRLKQAVEELDIEAEWEMKPFELYPTSFDEPVNSMTTEYVLKYGIAPEKASKAIAETEKIALEDGLKINYKDLKLTCSRKAHRLIKYCQSRHPESSKDLIFKIYEANFTDNEIIADIDVLVRLSSSLGLDEVEIRNFLESNSYDFEVQIDEEDAIMMGVEAIPLYMLNSSEEQLTIPGAFEKDDFKIALKDLINGDIESKTFI